MEESLWVTTLGTLLLFGGGFGVFRLWRREVVTPRNLLRALGWGAVVGTGLVLTDPRDGLLQNLGQFASGVGGMAFFFYVFGKRPPEREEAFKERWSNVDLRDRTIAILSWVSVIGVLTLFFAAPALFVFSDQWSSGTRVILVVTNVVAVLMGTVPLLIFFLRRRPPSTHDGREQVG